MFHFPPLSSVRPFTFCVASLTDLRLALGTRLGVDEERMGAAVDPAGPDAAAMTVLHWLGWVQEGILSALQTG